MLILPAEAESFTVMPPIVDSGVIETGDKLFGIYDQSIYGQWHRTEQPLRYEGFGSYGRMAMLNDFGSSVDPVEHMRATGAAFVNLASQLSGSDQLGPEEIRLGYASGVSHENGECTHSSLKDAGFIVIGDIPFGMKTLIDKRHEAQLREYLSEQLYSGQVSDTFRENMELIIGHHSLSPAQSVLQTAHNTGGLLDGLRAGSLALEPEQTTMTRHDQLIRMALEVISTMLKTVSEHSNTYEPIRVILDKSEPLLDRIEREFGSAA